MELSRTDALPRMLTRLKLTAIRDQLDGLLDEASRRDLTLREALAFVCEREIARKDERRIEMACEGGSGRIDGDEAERQHGLALPFQRQQLDRLHRERYRQHGGDRGLPSGAVGARGGRQA